MRCFRSRLRALNRKTDSEKEEKKSVEVVRDKKSDGRETTYKTSYCTEVQWNGKGEPEQVWEWSDGLICHGLALHCTSNLENNEHAVCHNA